MFSNYSNKQIIFTATKEQLTCLVPGGCYQHLWSIVVSLPFQSNEKLIIAIEEFLRDLDILGIDIRLPDGSRWSIPFIWKIFPCHDVDDDTEDGKEKDAGRRWLSNFKHANSEGTGPEMICTTLVSLPRLRLLAVFCASTVAKFSRGPNTKRCSFTHFPLGW